MTDTSLIALVISGLLFGPMMPTVFYVAWLVAYRTIFGLDALLVRLGLDIQQRETPHD